jgi:hypothetical protein
MRSGGPVSLAARERLRDHQAAAAKVIATHSSAMARLDTLISRRAEVLAAQDALVDLAKAEVTTAVVAAAQLMGVQVAASLLDLSRAEVRRLSRSAES